MDQEHNIALRGYQPGDERSILATFNLVFRQVCGDGYVDRDLSFWDWQFRRSPFGHRISLAVTETGVVAAQYAGVVYPMTTAFGDCTFVHIVDSMTHPDHRQGLKRPGLFVRTALPWFELCHRSGDAVMYGYPVKAAERIGQRYLEYKPLRLVRYLLLPAATALTAPAGVELRQLTSIPPAIDAVFRRMSQGKKCLTTRDHRYLDWRYCQMPGASGRYETWMALRNGEPCGLTVLAPRHELVPESCTIADWVVAEGDDEAQVALLALAARRARDHGRGVVMAVFPDHSPEALALQKVGFTSVGSDEYLERRLTHRIYHPQMSTEWLAAHWWYTLGDSDLV